VFVKDDADSPPSAPCLPGRWYSVPSPNASLSDEEATGNSPSMTSSDLSPHDEFYAATPATKDLVVNGFS